MAEDIEKRETSPKPNWSVQESIDISLKVMLVMLLLFLCFLVLRPFILMVIWGLIIGVMIFPAFTWLTDKLKGRKKLAATLTTLGLVLILVLPTAFLTDSLLTGASVVRTYLTSSSELIPPPPESVGNIAIIGKSLYSSWSHASTDLSQFLAQYKSQIQSAGEWVLEKAGKAGVGLLQFVFSIIISGFVLANSKSGNSFAKRLGYKLAGEKGLKMVKDTETTIRSVGKGIIGVSVIQAFFIAIGLFVAGIPGAALWALIAMFLGIIQIGTLPVVIPVIIYGFYSMSTTWAVIFMIYMILVSPLDNVLKPILLGRGAPVPMLVVFLGAIGGFISFGIIGLFLGSVLLSFGYQLLQIWLEKEEQIPAD